MNPEPVRIVRLLVVVLSGVGFSTDARLFVGRWAARPTKGSLKYPSEQVNRSAGTTQGNRVKGVPSLKRNPGARGPHKTRHCEPASLDAGEAIQGVFMMYSPWIASSLRSSQ